MLVNLFVFVIGTIFGSFLNVCIHRLAKEESIVFPASHCPKCKTPIKVIDNIPLISFLLLRGKCRTCREKISLRYPIVELLAGLTFLCFYLKTDSLLTFFFWALLGCLLIIGFFTDLEEQIIPDEIVVIGILAGFIFNITKGQTINSLLGAASGFAIFFLIAEIAKFIVKKDAIGFGDLKLAAMLGAFLGTSGFWNTFLLAYLLGAVISIGLIIFKFKKMGDYIPFGPFLIIGAALTLYFGPFLILQYFNPLIQ